MNTRPKEGQSIEFPGFTPVPCILDLELKKLVTQKCQWEKKRKEKKKERKEKGRNERRKEGRTEGGKWDERKERKKAYQKPAANQDKISYNKRSIPAKYNRKIMCPNPSSKAK